MDENIAHLESKQLVQVKKLIDEGKLDKAFSILKSFEEKGDSTFYNAVLCNFLKCQVFRFQGLFEKVIKLGEQTYNDSLELGENFLSIDILLLLAEVLYVVHKFNKSYDKISLAEEHLNRLTGKLSIDYKLRETHIALEKGSHYLEKNELDIGLKFLEQSLAMAEEIGAKKEIAESLAAISILYGIQGKLDIALKYGKQAVSIAEKCKAKWALLLSLFYLGNIFQVKGELDNAIKSLERALATGRENNNKYWMSFVAIVLSEAYRRKGQLDLALENIEQVYEFSTDIGFIKNTVTASSILIQILIDKGDLKRAQQILDQLEEINIQWSDKMYSSVYCYCKALILKTSTRAHNRVKAEELLRQILEQEYFDMEIFSLALLNL
ncbi:MAG: tetratricopeptide repeat protein [Promethearchaeota archaeon]